MTPQDKPSTPSRDAHSTGYAIHTVANPDKFCHNPCLMQAAWAQLKAERGHPVNFARLGRAAYLIVPAADPAHASSETAPVHIGMSPEALDRMRRRAVVLRWLDSMTGGGDAA